MPLRWSWGAFILGTPILKALPNVKCHEKIFLFFFPLIPNRYLLGIMKRKWEKMTWGILKKKMPIVWVSWEKRKDGTWHFKKWNAYSCEHFVFWNTLQIFTCKYIKIFYPNLYNLGVGFGVGSSINNKGKNKRV